MFELLQFSASSIEIHHLANHRIETITIEINDYQLSLDVKTLNLYTAIRFHFSDPDHSDEIRTVSVFEINDSDLLRRLHSVNSEQHEDPEISELFSRLMAVTFPYVRTLVSAVSACFNQTIQLPVIDTHSIHLSQPLTLQRSGSR